MHGLKHDNDQLWISFLGLRKSIGILGITLPLVLLIGTFTLGTCHGVQHSISHYYYTIMGDVFVGILCAVTFLLILYTGYDEKDNISSSLAGVFAILVAFFPTSPNTDWDCTVRELPISDARVVIHYVAAGLFFLTLACISLFLFTISTSSARTQEKTYRNRVYRVCGVIILVCIALIPLAPDAWEAYRPVFWLEWAALAAFSVSWLIKGELLLKDKAIQNRE